MFISFQSLQFSADYVLCVNIVLEYGEPYLASKSEVYSKSNKEVHTEQQDKQIIRKPADFTHLPRLRGESGKEQLKGTIL